MLVSVSSPNSPVVDHLADLAMWEAELAADPQVMASSLAMRWGRCLIRVIRGAAGHPLVVILVLTACATLVVGNDCVSAIWQWAAGTGQDVLARTGARHDGWTGRYVVPSEATFRRVLTAVEWRRPGRCGQRVRHRRARRRRPGADATRGGRSGGA
jgi:hypothetical protein